MRCRIGSTVRGGIGSRGSAAARDGSGSDRSGSGSVVSADGGAGSRRSNTLLPGALAALAAGSPGARKSRRGSGSGSAGASCPGGHSGSGLSSVTLMKRNR